VQQIFTIPTPIPRPSSNSGVIHYVDFNSEKLVQKTDSEPCANLTCISDVDKKVALCVQKNERTSDLLVKFSRDGKHKKCKSMIQLTICFDFVFEVTNHKRKNFMPCVDMSKKTKKRFAFVYY